MISELCNQCKFFLWFENYGYRCSIKGCFNNSKFIAFDFDKWKDDVMKVEEVGKQ